MYTKGGFAGCKRREAEDTSWERGETLMWWKGGERLKYFGCRKPSNALGEERKERKIKENSTLLRS